MAKIFYLTCPSCRERFYITEEFAGQGYDWCCPFCERTFKEHESLEGQQASPAPAGTAARPSHTM